MYVNCWCLQNRSDNDNEFIDTYHLLGKEQWRRREGSADMCLVTCCTDDVRTSPAKLHRPCVNMYWLISDRCLQTGGRTWQLNSFSSFWESAATACTEWTLAIAMPRRLHIVPSLLFVVLLSLLWITSSYALIGYRLWCARCLKYWAAR